MLALTANSNVSLLAQQCIQFEPTYAVMADINAARRLAHKLAEADCVTEVLLGKDALCEVARAVEVDTRLLPHDVDPDLALARVVRLDRRADAVLELRDHLARAVVGGGVRTEEDEDVDVEPDREAADLDIAFLKDVEEADLHEVIEVGQFVHREDAAMHARDETEVQRLFRGE